VVISASHNPWTDNGIKVFSGDGYKLPDAHELAIEQEIFARLRDAQPRQPLSVKPAPSLPGEADLRHAYIAWLGHSVGADLSRLRVLVDCAHGAATAEAPNCFAPAAFRHRSPAHRPMARISMRVAAPLPRRCGQVVAEKVGSFDLGSPLTGTRTGFCSAMQKDEW